jgi:hypothetical protein
MSTWAWQLRQHHQQQQRLHQAPGRPTPQRKKRSYWRCWMLKRSTTGRWSSSTRLSRQSMLQLQVRTNHVCSCMLTYAHAVPLNGP